MKFNEKTKRGIPVEMPSCGIFVGTGVYNTSKDYLLGTMPGHYSWQPQDFMPDEMIERIIEDNQGNLAQVWGTPRGHAPRQLAEWKYALSEIGISLPPPDWENGRYLFAEDCQEIKAHEDRAGAGFLSFLRKAAAKGIYVQFIYTELQCKEKWVKQFSEFAPNYLGYDFGERYCFRIDDRLLQEKELGDITLSMLADQLLAEVNEYVTGLHKAGWGNVAATCGNFHLDYEVLGGADIPMFEDSGSSVHFTSALSRGLYRQYGLPIWGSHIAHEHYSWLPNANPRKMDVLVGDLFLKYMGGAKILLCESGNWFVEANLCSDSPKFLFPQRYGVPEDEKESHDTRKHYNADPQKYIEAMHEAREFYPAIDYNSPICQAYRKVISDFYDFVKENNTPVGQPEVSVALAKGNLDLSNVEYCPNNAVAGAYKLADIDSRWYEGAPERGWETIKNVFFPRPPIAAPNRNLSLSGTPYGVVDIVSFAGDNITSEFLTNNYKCLLFSGWNTCSDKQYSILKDYVASGGVLCIAIPHLSTNETRDYSNFSVDDLVNKGDFSELCGVRVKGRGERFYWATPAKGVSCLGVEFPHRFGTMQVCMGDIEITDPATEVLIIDDEQARPIVIRRRFGKGEVFFINTWCYPGALDHDIGPGSTLDSKGLMGLIYAYIAKLCRGNVWISDDGENPGENCDYISCSYFPESEKICLYNADFINPRKCFLYNFGIVDEIELSPGEFRFVDAAKLSEE